MADHQEKAAAEAEEERYGSRFAQMFGFVTPEDRQRWQQARAQNKKHVSSTKSVMKSGVGSMMEFGDKNMGAKLNAAHRMAEQEVFETSHNKETQRTVGQDGRVVESVAYTDKEDSAELEADFGY
ncbi:hypothetical protein [Brevibacterium oceani]|uniref:hypothetical protein n=1 Tax=Brevibacterium oceani TaxID=358099 RepID=UPI0015E6ED14|nr:hypothetical protein [Brevibacterium oceani]